MKSVKLKTLIVFLKSNVFTMKEMKKSIKLLEFYWTSIYPLMNKLRIYAPKYQSPSIVSIGKKIALQKNR
jgi:hypothetical protein